MAKADKEGRNKPKKDKDKEVKRATNKAPTKVIIRHLPPTMTEEEFLKHIDPMPEHDDYYFAEADWSLGYEATCRAYINFKNYEDVFLFRDRFDGYVFVDLKGCEYPAIVEFAPFQGFSEIIPHTKKNVVNTIEEMTHYQDFLVALAQEREAAAKGGDVKIEFNLDASKKEEIKSTPLLEYLANKKKNRRDEKKQKEQEKERRRKESASKFIWTKKSKDESKPAENRENHHGNNGNNQPSGSGGGGATGGGASGGNTGSGDNRNRMSKKAARNQRRREEFEQRKRERQQQAQNEKNNGTSKSSVENRSNSLSNSNSNLNSNSNSNANINSNSNSTSNSGENSNETLKNTASNEARFQDDKPKRRNSHDRFNNDNSNNTNSSYGNENSRRFNEKRDRHRNRRGDDRRDKNKSENETPKTIVKKTDLINPIVKNFIESCSKACVASTAGPSAATPETTNKNEKPTNPEADVENLKKQMENVSLNEDYVNKGSTKSSNDSNKNETKDGGKFQNRRELQSQRSAEERRIRNKDRPSIAIYQPKALLLFSDDSSKEKPTSILSSDGETKRKEERHLTKKLSRRSDRQNTETNPGSSDGESKKRDDHTRTKKVARYSARRAEMKAEKCLNEKASKEESQKMPIQVTKSDAVNPAGSSNG